MSSVDASWDDYVAEWDMMFPDDFYMGVVFRFQEGEKFYLSDRRQGGREYHFYKRQGGWAKIRDGMVENDPEFGTAHNSSSPVMNSLSNSKNGRMIHPFDKIDPATEGQDGNFKTGKFGNYGLVYIDNIFIGDAVEDLVLPVEPQDKLSITWGTIKDAY